MKLQTTYTLERDDGEITATVVFDFRPGSSAVHTLRNGDPGYPADPDEVDIVSVRDEGGNDVDLTAEEDDAIERHAIEVGADLFAEAKDQSKLDRFLDHYAELDWF